MNPDPWSHLAEQWPDVQVQLANLTGAWGLTVWNAGATVIYLAHTLGKTERRCVLAHEVQHLERGQPCADLSLLDEARVVAATARWLLPDFGQVCDVLARHDIRAAAENLRVTRRVLTERLDDMNTAEQAMLGEALPALERAS